MNHKTKTKRYENGMRIWWRNEAGGEKTLREGRKITMSRKRFIHV